MKLLGKFGRKLVFGLAAAGLLTVPAQAQYDYTTIDDPVAVANSGTTYATSISGNTVAGYYFGPYLHGFYHILGTTNYTTLDEPNGFQNGSSSTEAYGISGNNIVGTYQNYLGGAAGYYGFIYNIASGTYTTLEDTAVVHQDTSFTYVYAIDGNNIAGVVIATAPIANTYEEGFVTALPAGIYTFDTFYYPEPSLVRDEGSYYETNYTTYVSGISGANVVGYWLDENSVYHGYIYNLNTASYTMLASPSGGGCPLTGIDGDNVVGYYADPNHSYNYSGFIYNLTTGKYVTSLRDPLGPGNNFVEGISGSTVVGYYLDNNGQTHGFVASIPIPVLSLHVSGNKEIFTASNGVPSAACFIIDTPNLALPINQWTELSSNVFNANGVFTYTNPIVPGQPPAFYALSKTP